MVVKNGDESHGRIRKKNLQENKSRTSNRFTPFGVKVFVRRSRPVWFGFPDLLNLAANHLEAIAIPQGSVAATLELQCLLHTPEI